MRIVPKQSKTQTCDSRKA